PIANMAASPTDFRGSWSFGAYNNDGRGLRPILFLDDNTGHVLQALGNARFQADTWYHLAFTYDGTTNSDAVKIYVNGFLNTQYPGSLPAGHDVSLLVQAPALAGPSKAYIDDLGVWGSTLNADDIYLLANDVYSPTYEQAVPASGGSYTITVANAYDV